MTQTFVRGINEAQNMHLTHTLTYSGVLDCPDGLFYAHITQ